MRVNGVEKHAVACVPQTNGAAPTATGDSATIRTKRNAKDLVHFPSEGVEMHAIVCVPQPDGLVATATGDSTTIRTKRDVFNSIRMSSEGLDKRAIACVPQAEGVVIPATDKCVAIRTERNTSDKIRMPYEYLCIISFDSWGFHIHLIDSRILIVATRNEHHGEQYAKYQKSFIHNKPLLKI